MQRQTHETVAAQIKAISARLVAGRTRVQQCEAVSLSAQKEVVVTQSGVAEAQRRIKQAQMLLRAALTKDAAAVAVAAEAQTQALLATLDLSQLNDSLLPLKRSMDGTGSDATGSQAQTSNRKRVRFAPTSQPPSPLPPPSLPLPPPPQQLHQAPVCVESVDLGALIEQMQSNHGIPAVYDLQGMVMQYLQPGPPTIVSPGITLRNGTIQLRPNQSLEVESRGVTLHSVSVVGGNTGVIVSSGGSISMTACNIQDVEMGVWLMGNGTLEASNLNVTNARAGGLCMEGRSTATLSDSKLCGRGRLLFLDAQASASLTGCRLTSETGRPIAVYDEASLQLSGCAFSGAIVQDSTASVIFDTL